MSGLAGIFSRADLISRFCIVLAVPSGGANACRRREVVNDLLPQCGWNFQARFS